MRGPIVAFVLLLVSFAIARPGHAAWPNSPFTNLPVCAVAGDQLQPKMVSDGAGGAIVTWSDARSGNYDIYAQRILASGVADPAWPADGRALCTATGNQLSPAIESDGASGAIVTWADYRGGNYDIYAQHVLASGLVDPAWPANGRALCTATNSQQSPTIATDGAGGAIVTWQDLRGSSQDIYAQRVLASGAVDPAWPVNGRVLCAALGTQQSPVIIRDGAGGAIVAWQDNRSGSHHDVYAQRVLASGVVDPAWPADGRGLCTATGDQFGPRLVEDGAGGAIVTWQDLRGATYDIYAGHVLAAGIADPAWPLNGRALCTAAGEQTSPGITTDGAGGAIVAWQDSRSGNHDIYAQHVHGSGIVDAAWPADGRALCVAAGSQLAPALAPDGAGGAFVTWYDLRTGGSSDVYLHRVQATGMVDPAWPSDGRAVSAATYDQTNQVIVGDGTGGAIVTWTDLRSGTNYDVYAQRVARFGYLGNPEATIASVRDVPNDQGGRVKLSWHPTYLEAEPWNFYTTYNLFRSVPPQAAAARAARGARVRAADDDALQPGDIVALPSGSQVSFWEMLASVQGLNLPGYSYVAPTTGDSVAGSNPRTLFMVQTRSGGCYWNSPPDSGYSVDNLPPGTPAPFTGQYAAGTARLHWNPNTEADLAGYRLYRGASAAFVPGPGNLVAALADTGYADPAGAPYVYKLTAIDSHGNESPVATLVPSGVLGAEGDAAPTAPAFAAPSPNPAAGATMLRYALPRAGVVRVAVYDAAGRVVRELAHGAQAAGDHALAWDLRDGAGRAVRAGLYFARLEAGGRTLVRRVAVTR